MPEGHTLHRLAGELSATFGGRAVRVTSPQGRFAESAALVDGSVVTGAEAWGKHLFVAADTAADHCALDHLRVVVQRGLDFGRVDVEAAVDDQLFRAAYDMQALFGIKSAQIAGA